MIRHLEMVVHELLSLVGGWMFALSITSVVAMAAAAFLGLNLYKFDRESYFVAWRRLLAATAKGWTWALAAGLLLVEIYGLVTVQQSTSERLYQASQAPYIAAADQGGGPTVQRAPHIAYLETTTTTRRIVLPPNLIASDVNALPGWSPEEARYDSRPAVNVEDALVKDDKTVVLNRTITVQRYLPLKFSRSEVDVRLRFRDRRLGQRRQFYQAAYLGKYSYANPFPDVRRVHFAFPLPENSGTLSDFHFKVNGKELPAPDITQGFDFESDVKPGETTAVEVAYTHLGSQSWSYDVTGHRERITDFHLTVHTDKGDVKFQRGSLYPTHSDGTNFAWDLQNQITSQSISLFFPSVASEETVRRLFIFGPVGLVAFVVLMLVWSRLRGAGTGPWRAILASLAYCGGFALTSYLLGYVALGLALLIAFSVTAALQTMALGPRLWIPVGAAAILPFPFLAGTNTGLILTLLGMVTLWAAIRETTRGQEATA